MFNMYEGRFGGEVLMPIKNDEVEVVSHHYQTFLQPNVHTLDDITWADLDMDVLYKKINMTYCGAGDLMLYGMLRQPCCSHEQLAKRYQIITWAKTQEAQREEVIGILSRAGKRYEDDLEQPFETNHGKQNRSKYSYGLTIFFVLSLLLALLLQGVFYVVPVLVFVASIIRYWVLHKQLEPYMDSLVYLVAHIEVLHKLAKADLSLLPEVKQQAQALSEQLSSIRKSSSLSYFEEIAGNFNIFSQKESRLFDAYSSFMYEHKALVVEALAFVGMIDACISMASYQVYDQVNCDITLKENTCSMFAKAMIHPLVEHCVENDIDIQEHRLLTGSNATGKSTYLKMVALNAVLAQSFHFVYAKTYVAGYFQIATSMTIHDHLERKESTFVAEIKSLKHLLDLDHEACPTLCIIDEILRGTNTLERIASSSAILKQFATHRGICLGATHDIELTQILKDVFKNYHFSETMKQDRMVFDYKIHEGVTTTRNAIALLSMFGYDHSLVQQAKKRLQYFETKGEWQIIA